MTQPSITCPRCGRTSYSQGDIDQGYCGWCHWWTSDPSGMLNRPEVIAAAEAQGAITPLTESADRDSAAVAQAVVIAAVATIAILVWCLLLARYGGVR